jgi:hypothetical protein
MSPVAARPRVVVAHCGPLTPKQALRALAPADIHPARQPQQTRIARSLVDAAAWTGTDRGAQAVLATLMQAYDVGEYAATHAIRTLEAEGLVFTVSPPWHIRTLSGDLKPGAAGLQRCLLRF